MGLLSHTAMVFVGDSDDSDTEGGLGNVERVVMRPPGHSGKAKRGHLCFNAAFETGNLGRVDFITENEYDLFVRPDTCNPRVRFWFHFSVENVQKDQRIIFNIVNLSQTKSLFQNGMTPVVRSTSRPKWQRLPSEQVYYYRSPEHSKQFVLSFIFAFDRDEDKYFFAFAFPYSYSRCKYYFDKLKQSHLADVTSLGETVQKRSIYAVTIACKSEVVKVSPDDNEEEEEEAEEEEEEQKKPPIVVVLARAHPGDSNTTYIAQGMIDFMISRHTIAEQLRNNITIIVVPVLNPDGVFLGNSKSSLLGVDLNRSWNSMCDLSPELSLLKTFIFTLAEEKNLEIIIDLHGSPCLTGMFVQGNAFDSVYRFERHIVFPKLLSQNCPDFESENAMYNASLEKDGTCRRFFCSKLNEQSTNTYSLEVSQYGHKSPNGDIIPYSEEDYLMHGRRIIRSLWEYFKVTNVISRHIGIKTAVSLSSPACLITSELADKGFSMLRLRHIAQQRDIFSSLESLTSQKEEEDEAQKPEYVTSTTSRKHTLQNAVFQPRLGAKENKVGYTIQVANSTHSLKNQEQQEEEPNEALFIRGRSPNQ